MGRQRAIGLAAIVSALACACSSTPTASPPAIVGKPPLTGDATGFTYQLSEQEKKYGCKKLTGAMQVRILQMRGEQGKANTSLASRGMQSVSQSIFGGTAAAIDTEQQYTQDHAMLEAYNRQLAAKNCKTFDIAAELNAGANTKRTPTPKSTENSSPNKKP